MVSASNDSRTLVLLHTVAIYVWIILATAVLASLTILTSFFPNSGNAMHAIARTWGRCILWASRTKVIVHGRENIQPSESVIFMSNHQSNFDIPVFFSALPVRFRWLAKAELFKIPIFGRAMRAAGYISIDRSDGKSALRSLKRAAQSIRTGSSVLIFPEGTRSQDGRLLPFKTGGFVLAVDAGVPIVPLAIQGTRQVMPKGGKLIRRGTVTITLMPPIETSDFTRKTKKVLMEEVQRSIASAMARNEAGGGHG